MIRGEGAVETQDGPWRVGDGVHRCRAPDATARDAVAAGMDLLILDDSVEVGVDAIAELRACAASDPMIAIVSPRVENAGVAAAFARELPATTYTVMPGSRCFYVKASVLNEFPLPATAPDWDQYALAVNRCGFRCAIANRAFVEGVGRVPEDLAARAAAWEAAFPGTVAALASMLAGASREAERLIAGLAPDASGRSRIAFDATHLGPSHSGTAELARSLIRHAAEAWRDRLEVAVVASEATHTFHFGDMARPPRRVAPAAPDRFAAFIRIGQPFGWKEVDHAVRRAPTLVFFMLDTIGLDCVRLAPDDLDGLWRFVLAEADGLLFNSAFTERQFRRRFGVRPGLPTHASLHPTETAALSEPRTGGGTILIVGNGFAHKRVEATARLIATGCPGAEVVGLGLAPGAVASVTGIPSGGLDEAAMTALYRDAGVVVYPSVYEGFGFPVVEALRHRRPVILRRLPPFAEIAAAVAAPANLHLYDTDDDLLRLLAADLRWIPEDRMVQERNWTDCVTDLGDILDRAIAGVSYERVLRRVDFMRGRLAWARSRHFAAEGLDDEADRLAALAGRLAQGATRRIATTGPGRALLRLGRRIISGGERR